MHDSDAPSNLHIQCPYGLDYLGQQIFTIRVKFPQAFLTASCITVVGSCLNAAVIVGTDFTGRTISGTTANNITFTTNGISSPGSSLTAVENESNSQNDVTTENGGLFTTGDATDYLALDLNVDNEDGWYFDVPIVVSSGSIDITTLDFSINHFQNTGVGQGNNSPKSDYRAELIGSVSGLVANDSVLNIGGAYAGGSYADSLDLTTTIDDTETWTLRIYADYTGGVGNNVGFDSFALNGTVVPEPSSALLGVAGGLLLLRRRRS